MCETRKISTLSMQGMQTRQRQITILPLNLHAMMVLRMSASFISCSCALNVPQESVEAWITSNADQALDTPIAAYCYSGARSGRAVVKFLAAGFNYSTNAGGYEDAKVEMEQVRAHTPAHMQIHLRIHCIQLTGVCRERGVRRGGETQSGRPLRNRGRCARPERFRR
jgi:rhodanese-related sulfurtransferase